MEIDRRKEMVCRSGVRTLTAVVLIMCSVALPLLVLFSDHRTPILVWIQGVRVTLGSQDDFSTTHVTHKDMLLHGLLSPNFDEHSCLSRYQSVQYRKASPFSPSPDLVARLRKYEALHKKCGPNTPLYKKSIEQLKSNRSAENSECNFIVWTPFNGLGNRMLTLASSFLFALLTNRVLLIHETNDLVDLFCEPFPETSWLLPSDFPVKELTKLHLGSARSYGSMLKNKVIGVNLKASAEYSLPSYVYLHLEHDYRRLDRLFFCEDDQFLLRKVNWLVLQSDIYFVPSLFLIPQFANELQRLFPNKNTVFHHLGRYLFHPTNSVWGMIVRFYESYLAKAEERIGIQIRTFSRRPISFDNFSGQIISCSQQKNILPPINFEKLQPASLSKEGRLKAVLITSLYSEYYDKIKTMYYEHPTTTGEVISIYQPTHEEQQHTEKQSHNQKALAEIYLLALCDVLVTSGWSTFGYVAQGLAGLRPWILLSPHNGKAPDPPCVRAMSMEPCFHTPPNFDCRTKKYIDMGTVVRHVRHCEDVGQGVKLVD